MKIVPTLKWFAKALCWLGLHAYGKWEKSDTRYVFPWGNHPGFWRYYSRCERCRHTRITHEEIVR